ncbi:MAG: Gfo/Idh/MocA family protein [Phycisphaeraceae bacterium]
MVVKYGVIGCGAIAQRRHIPEAEANPDSTVAAVSDPLEDRVAEVARQYGAEAFTDHSAMLKKADIDAVVVAGPNALHAAMTIEALEAGKHVLVEKPMAVSRDEAEQMVQAAKGSGKYLMIGMNQRLMPPHVKAKEVLEAGKLGRVLTFRTAFKHAGPEGWSIDAGKSWFFRKQEAFMGVTGDLGVHKADLMRWLLGDEYAEIGGLITTVDKRGPSGELIALDDNAILTCRTESGTLGSIICSWTNYGPEENYTVVYCEKGVMQIGVDPQYPVVVHYHNGNQELYKVGGISTNVSQAVSEVIDTFTRHISEGTPPPIDGVEGYRALNAILTAMEAAEQGRMLKVDNVI